MVGNAAWRRGCRVGWLPAVNRSFCFFEELRVSDSLTDDDVDGVDELATETADPGETASLSADLSDIDPDGGEVFCAEAPADAMDEQEEVLPLEFLDDPETFSSVFPREGLEDDEAFSSETVIMSPSEVRRMASKAKGVSSRRAGAVGGSSAGARRSRRNEEEDLSPEELAARRRNDRKAKLMIYAIIFVLTLAFAALLTYKLPGMFKDTFPDGIWPWNRILPAYTGHSFDWFGLVTPEY